MSNFRVLLNYLLQIFFEFLLGVGISWMAQFIVDFHNVDFGLFNLILRTVVNFVKIGSTFFDLLWKFLVVVIISQILKDVVLESFNSEIEFTENNFIAVHIKFVLVSRNVTMFPLHVQRESSHQVREFNESLVYPFNSMFDDILLLFSEQVMFLLNVIFQLIKLVSWSENDCQKDFCKH